MNDLADLKARNATLGAFVDFNRQATGGEGELAGVTVGVKSNIAVKGLPWTGGMGTRRGVLAERDAEAVRRLRNAGATILGTLNMHEAALGATSDNAFYGRTHNPHRHGYTPGGSSGGSGAAVAAGLCDLALGTDTLGSVRIPASYCGVYGLKPTYGVVPDDGLLFLEPSLDSIGPLARDLDTLERGWIVLAGEEAGPRLKAGVTEEGATASSPRPPSRGPAPFFRLLTLADLGGIEVQPAVRAAYQRALAALGLPATAITLPHDLATIRLAGLVDAVHYLIGELGDARHGDQVSPELKFILDALEGHQPRPEVRTATREALVQALGDDGVMLTPTTPQVAFPHAPGTRVPVTQAGYTSLANIAGLPALAIPAGRDESGLPVSVQLMGPAGSELALIALARRLEPELGGAVHPQGV